MEVQYLTNERGKKTAVQISLRQWQQIEKDLHKLDVLQSLQQAFHEMQLHEQGKLTTPTTQQLLAEL